MILIDAVRVSDGAPVEVYVRRTPKFGATFRQKGVVYRRVPSVPARATFGVDGFKNKGPVEMWSEPPMGRGPRANAYSKDGFPLMRNMRDVHDYESRSKDTGRPVTWTR